MLNTLDVIEKIVNNRRKAIHERERSPGLAASGSDSRQKSLENKVQTITRFIVTGQ